MSSRPFPCPPGLRQLQGCLGDLLDQIGREDYHTVRIVEEGNDAIPTTRSTRSRPSVGLRSRRGTCSPSGKKPTRQYFSGKNRRSPLTRPFLTSRPRSTQKHYEETFCNTMAYRWGCQRGPASWASRGRSLRPCSRRTCHVLPSCNLYSQVVPRQSWAVSGRSS